MWSQVGMARRAATFALTRRLTIPKRFLSTTSITDTPRILSPRCPIGPHFDADADAVRSRFTAIRSCANSTGNSGYSPLNLGESQLSTDQKVSPKHNLLLKRFRTGGVHYYTALSAETFAPTKDIYLPSYQITRRFHAVAGSCNGLLCLHLLGGDIVLWNPSINDFKFLPQSSVQRTPSTSKHIPYCFGFGFDCKSKDYKFIRFMLNCFEDEEGSYRGSERQIELYSLKTNSWKEISMSETQVSVFLDGCTYINGSYYWLAIGGSFDDKHILSFDFSDEKFSLIPFPNIKKSYNFKFLDLDGMFSLIAYPEMGTEKSFELWVMNNGSWGKEFVFDTSGVERPLGFWNNCELLFLESLNHELLLYNRATGTVKNLGVSDVMGLIPYVETLVPLTGES